jgi:hypothetical protein
MSLQGIPLSNTMYRDKKTANAFVIIGIAKVEKKRIKR